MERKVVEAAVVPCEDFPEGLAGSCEYNFPTTVQEAIETFGEGVVLSNFNQELTKKVQTLIRTDLKAGKTMEALQEHADKWKLGMARPKKSKLDKALGFIEDIDDPDALAAILQKIKEQRAGK